MRRAWQLSAGWKAAPVALQLGTFVEPDIAPPHPLGGAQPQTISGMGPAVIGEQWRFKVPLTHPKATESMEVWIIPSFNTPLCTCRACAWCWGKGMTQTSCTGTRRGPPPTTAGSGEENERRPTYHLRWGFSSLTSLNWAPAAHTYLAPNSVPVFSPSKEPAVRRALNLEIAHSSGFWDRMGWPLTPGLAPSFSPAVPCRLSEGLVYT